MPPGRLQILTFGYRLDQCLHSDDAVQPAVGELWPRFQPEFAWCHAAQQPADMNLWLQDQPELEKCHAAEQPAVIDFRFRVLPELL